MFWAVDGKLPLVMAMGSEKTSSSSRRSTPSNTVTPTCRTSAA